MTLESPALWGPIQSPKGEAGHSFQEEGLHDSQASPWWPGHSQLGERPGCFTCRKKGQEPSVYEAPHTRGLMAHSQKGSNSLIHRWGR